MARERYFQSRCIEIRELCQDVRHIVFQRADGETMTWTPGQFVMIHFPDPDGVQLNRSYSMSEASTADATFALCVKRVEGGLGSGLIHGLGVGDAITTSGPYGRFVLTRNPPRDLVLVATGTGVAPFRAMIGQLEELMGAGHRVWLLFGVRFEGELLYDDEWRALAERWPDAFRYRTCVSRPGPDYAGVRGYVTGLLAELTGALQPADAMAWLCGVPAMIDDVRDALQAQGFAMRAIKTEKYVSPPPPRARADASQPAAAEEEPG